MWRMGIVILAACAGSVEESGDTDEGACGDVSTWDLSIAGVVEGAEGLVAGATVTLEDRGWQPGATLGSGETDEEGRFLLDATGVTSVENCWGTLLNYVVVAEDGERRGERGVNSPLYDAIVSGTLEADISGAPILVE